MPNIFNPWTAVAALAVISLPLLMLTTGVLVLAAVSTCSRNPTRREHSRQLIQELASFAKVLKTGDAKQGNSQLIHAPGPP